MSVDITSATHCSRLCGKAAGLTTGDIDTGASHYIAEDKIKLKNDALNERFMETGIEFDNDSELAADVVVFATGYEPPPPSHCDG